MNKIDEVGNHPALLMYAIGNEWNIGDPVLRNKVNQYMNFARLHLFPMDFLKIYQTIF